MIDLVPDSLFLYYRSQFHVPDRAMPINNLFLPVVEAKNSEKLSEWISCQGSLTDKLREKTGSTQLNLLNQHWVNPGWWHEHVLSMDDNMLFEREIIMKSHDQSYWYARSIIPQQCYLLEPSFFTRLENESIKNLIFNEPKVQRNYLISYPVNSQCTEFYWVKKHINSINGVLWVRLSAFIFLQQAPFYLLEILLPELENLC